MLAEARETSAENDGKYLKRSGCEFFFYSFWRFLGMGFGLVGLGTDCL